MAAQSPVTDYPFTEAPASVELRFTLRGYDCSLVLKDITGQAVLTRLDGAISHLEKIGSQPTAHDAATAAPATNGHAQAAFDSIAPTCPTHGKAMKQSQHGGWFCPVKVAADDGTGKAVFCKQKVS